MRVRFRTADTDSRAFSSAEARAITSASANAIAMPASVTAVSYTHLTLPTTPYV